jgi:hypothetical protein
MNMTMALPLIALPGISPRIVTGRKRLAPTIVTAPFSPSLYGEKVPADG